MTMGHANKSYTICFLVGFAIVTCCSGAKNVLFLIADDLRPELPAYYETGSQFFPSMYTPNIDALVGKSLVLKHAYVQLPLCGPSRTSFMTGRRPDTTHVYNLDDYWRNVGGDFNTIPEYFKNNGYSTAGLGKIFHEGTASGNDDDAQSWTETYFHGTANFESSQKSWNAIDAIKLQRKDLIDEQIADQAITTLQNLAPAALSGTKNFFVAVGFRKPHLPFVVPQSVMDTHYPSNSMFLPTNPYVPVDMPSVAWRNWGELRGYTDISSLNVTGDENNTLPDANVLELRRAYYSAVTWMDEQLGRVVNELTTLGLQGDTVVSLIGDHGFLLGEHGGWCKQTLFELATRTPMMIHIPGVTDGGVLSEQLAEFVDLFPTLVDAAGLGSLALCPEDSSAVTACTEGVSLVPLANNPNTALRNATFSQQPRGQRMGYSIRTQSFRYTEWVDFDSTTYTPDWTASDGTELYNLINDPDENVNVASDPAYSNEVTTLSGALHAGWRSAIF